MGGVARASLAGRSGGMGQDKVHSRIQLVEGLHGRPYAVTTESTGGGARVMAANDVSRLMPSFSRSFKSPDVRRSFVSC